MSKSIPATVSSPEPDVGNLWTEDGNTEFGEGNIEIRVGNPKILLPMKETSSEPAMDMVTPPPIKLYSQTVL